MLNIALWLMASWDVVAFVNSKKVYVASFTSKLFKRKLSYRSLGTWLLLLLIVLLYYKIIPQWILDYAMLPCIAFNTTHWNFIIIASYSQNEIISRVSSLSKLKIYRLQTMVEPPPYLRRWDRGKWHLCTCN